MSLGGFLCISAFRGEGKLVSSSLLLLLRFMTVNAIGLSASIESGYPEKQALCSCVFK